MSAAPSIALFVAGAHKAGTTALYQALCQHPELAGHAPSELSFFVEDAEYARGFDSRAWRRYAPTKPARAFVAKHVKLAYRPEALARLAAHSPAVELVVVLRHPVERAYSAFWHARAHGREELATFEQALAAEDARLAAGRVPWHDTAYVRNGAYAAPLAAAIACFGRARVHVFELAELRARPLELLRGLYARLGVEPGFRPDLERGANRAKSARSPRLALALGRVFDSRARAKRALRACVPDGVALALRHRLVRWNTRPLAVPAMEAATRARLLACFRAENARVAELLGREFPHWER
jgi:hypothetical protein